MPYNDTLYLGRIVQGSTTEKQDKTFAGVPIPPEKQQTFFAVAVEKQHAQVFLNNLIGFAWGEYAREPQVQANIALVAQDLNFDKFSLKVEDGDTNPTLVKSGHARGCYVFKFKSSFPINCCNAQNQPISALDVKKGYYVEVAFSASINGNKDHTAGIYLNPQMVRLVGYAEEIVSGPSADQLFGNRPAPQLPPGASATPIGSPYAMPGGTGAPVQYGNPTPPPAPQYGAPVPTPAGYAPPAAAPAPSSPPQYAPPAAGYPPQAPAGPAAYPPQPQYGAAPPPAPAGYPAPGSAAPSAIPPAYAGHGMQYPGSAPVPPTGAPQYAPAPTPSAPGYAPGQPAPYMTQAHAPAAGGLPPTAPVPAAGYPSNGQPPAPAYPQILDGPPRVG